MAWQLLQRHVLVSIWRAGPRTLSPPESRRYAVFSPHAGHGSGRVQRCGGSKSASISSAHSATARVICSIWWQSWGRHGRVSIQRKRPTVGGDTGVCGLPDGDGGVDFVNEFHGVEPTRRLALGAATATRVDLFTRNRVEQLHVAGLRVKQFPANESGLWAA